jgi:rhamnosyltransferase
MDLSSYQSFLDNLLIILVLYKSDLETSESFQSISSCLKSTDSKVDIFMYDNSPHPINSTTNSSGCKIHYILNTSNPGVSTAYNEGFIYAKEQNKQWLLLLDQDTKFEADFIQKYYNACRSNFTISLFAPILRLDSGEIYSPCKYKFPKTYILKKVEPGIYNIKNLSLLNSGILIRTSTFQEVGGYDERLKLDFSDFEFLDRYRKIKDNFVVVDTEGIHGFSGFKDERDASLARFNRYCESFIVLYSIYPNFLERAKLITLVFLRSAKLSFKFRFAGFITTFFKSLISM